MSREAFAREYGASEADLSRVEAFAHDHELSVVSASAARRTVILRGTAAQVQAAFSVLLSMYHSGGVTFRRRSGEVQLPAELTGVVEGVFGLDDRPQAHPQFRLAGPVGRTGGAAGAAYPHTAGRSFTPPELADLYGFPAGDGAGQTIAIIELGVAYRKADLKTYFAGLGGPQRRRRPPAGLPQPAALPSAPGARHRGGQQRRVCGGGRLGRLHRPGQSRRSEAGGTGQHTGRYHALN